MAGFAINVGKISSRRDEPVRWCCCLLIPKWSQGERCYMWEEQSCIWAGTDVLGNAAARGLRIACELGAIFSEDAIDGRPVSCVDWFAMFGTVLPKHQVDNPFHPGPDDTDPKAA